MLHHAARGLAIVHFPPDFSAAPPRGLETMPSTKHDDVASLRAENVRLQALVAALQAAPVSGFSRHRSIAHPKLVRGGDGGAAAGEPER